MKNEKDKNIHVIGLAVNVFVPGIGTLIEGETMQGILQLGLGFLSWILAFFLIGIPMLLGIWLWAVIGSAMRYKNKC